ncbi:MAG: type II toxin-antitoxin system mRNA interferase toxin, RelE/StbE family [Candidatus Parcubacteria bacterium]|nr:type II toxin-antitoxin system mRNA interferase toxin, RelE/StbE family [Candidatus Parcubacteria bacterium]
MISRLEGFEIRYTPTFKTEYKKLPIEIKKLTEKKELLFKKDIFSRQLKTHKLNGYTPDCWAFWINDKYRIVFQFGDDNIVYLVYR